MSSASCGRPCGAGRLRARAGARASSPRLTAFAQRYSQRAADEEALVAPHAPRLVSGNCWPNAGKAWQQRRQTRNPNSTVFSPVSFYFKPWFPILRRGRKLRLW